MSNIYSFCSGQHTPGPFIQMGPELTPLLPNSSNQCHTTIIDALFLSVCKCYLLTPTRPIDSCMSLSAHGSSQSNDSLVPDRRYTRKFPRSTPSDIRGSLGCRLWYSRALSGDRKDGLGTRT